MRKMGTVPLKYDMFNNLKLYLIFMNVVILYIRHLSGVDVMMSSPEVIHVVQALSFITTMDCS